MSEEELISIIKNVIDNNSKMVDDYKSGNERVLKGLMGLIMKETGGNANPELVTKKLIELLKE